MGSQTLLLGFREEIRNQGCEVSGDRTENKGPLTATVPVHSGSAASEVLTSLIGITEPSRNPLEIQLMAPDM